MRRADRAFGEQDRKSAILGMLEADEEDSAFQEISRRTLL